MKKSIALLVMVCGFRILPSYSHPASSIKLEYDKNTHRLTATIFHDSKDKTKHFIGNVEIALNGKTLVRQYFLSQTDNDHQICEYTIIDAKSDDEIKMVAACNIFGKKEQPIRIP